MSQENMEIVRSAFEAQSDREGMSALTEFGCSVPRRQVKWDRIQAAVVLCGIACAFVALSPSAWASTYVPNRTSDHAPNGCTRRDCTLREAITKANNHAGLDTIVLHGEKTYNLGLDNTAGDEDSNATGDLDILGSIAIESSNGKLATVDANAIDRVFDVVSPVSVTFRRIAIRDGQTEPSDHGGGINDYVGGALRLIRSRVVQNTASAPNGEGGGISADGGSLKVIRSVIAHNIADGGNAGAIEGEPNMGDEVIAISRSKIVGNRAKYAAGAIYDYNRTAITSSTISNNHADDGTSGAIESYGAELRITSSTLSGNTSTDLGGAVHSYGPGSNATLVNDTITKNHTDTGGGGIANEGAMTLNAVTVARNSAGTNGGGIDAELGVITARNSLIALNTKGSGFGPDCREASPGGIVSGGHNLIGTTADCTGTVFTPAHHDIINVNPRIAQLADNGGPTKTIPLRAGSKAINHAGSDAPARDQRGVKRRDPDIGSFERR
jgi:predicted outer membrane repeat protein